MIVLDDVPAFDMDPLLQVWTERIPLRNAIATHLGLVDERDSELPSRKDADAKALASKLLKSTIGSISGATFVNLNGPFCEQDGTCAFRKDGHLLYLDYQHVSPEGARLALKDFRIPSAE